MQSDAPTILAVHTPMKNHLIPFKLSAVERRVALAIFILGLAAYGQAFFSLAYQTDDYNFPTQQEDPAFVKWFLVWEQGRIFWWVLYEAILALGATPLTAFSVFGITLLAALILVGLGLCRLWEIADFLPCLIVTGFVAVNPFIADFITYHNSYPFLAAALAMAFGAVLSGGGGPRRLFLNAGLMALALATYQMVLAYAAAGVCLQLVILMVRSTANTGIGAWIQEARQAGWWRRLIPLVGGVFLYVAGYKVLAIVSGEHTSRAAFLPLHEYPHRFAQFLQELYWRALCPVPLVTPVLKLLAFALFFAAAVLCAWKSLQSKNWRHWSADGLLFAMMLGVASLCIYALSFLADAYWCITDRVFSTVAVVLAGAYCVVWSSRLALPRAALSLAALVLLGSFALTANQVMTDQQRMFRRDLLLANRIVSRLELLPNFNRVRRVWIVGGWRSFPDELPTTHWQLNSSATGEPWSRVTFLRELTGYKFETPQGVDLDVVRQRAGTLQEWPAAGCCTIIGDLAIVRLPKKRGAMEYEDYHKTMAVGAGH
jgi:hypothetical protein